VVEREVGKDWLQVCDPTPCDVSVPPGSAVHLRATKGGLTAHKKLLADHDHKAQLTLSGGYVPKPTGLCEMLDPETGLKRIYDCPK
jgi:hypothetical protein